MADLFTKSLPKSTFEKHVKSIGMLKIIRDPMIVGIRGRCRLEGESSTYMSLSNVKGALYFFSLRPRLFFPLGFYCYLARFLMRQHGKRHLVVTGTRGSVVG